MITDKYNDTAIDMTCEFIDDFKNSYFYIIYTPYNNSFDIKRITLIIMNNNYNNNIRYLIFR